MSKSTLNLPREKFNALAQMKDDEVRAILRDNDMLLPNSSSGALANSDHRKFSYDEALTIELARQLSDNAGVSLKEALRLITYTSAIQSCLTDEKRWQRSDFWLAVSATRSTWGDSARGSWPVTGFGPREYWSEMHYTGTFGAVAGEIAESIGRDQAMHPDSDPARIVMANVSAADRRLRKRAAELGIVIDSNEFAADAT